MKLRIIRFLAMLMITLAYQTIITLSFAQAPNKMSYQAVVRDASNKLVTSHAIGMRISILQGSVTGTAVYTETQTVNTDDNGLVSIEIGTGTTSDNFSAINWASGQYFLKTETDPTGGTSYTITGTNQLLSVPYALYAKTAENGFSGNYDSLTNKPSINDSISKYSVMIKGNQTIAGNKTFTGTITGTLNANNTMISNVLNPMNKQDAATKAYVDSLMEKITLLINKLNPKFINDTDGNIYKTVKIGNQVWMAENLKTIKYNDGIAIPLVTNDTVWSLLSTPGYCLDDDTILNQQLKFYNWYTVNTGKLCPTGWHVPTDAEWTTLSDFLGGDSIAGGKLKESGTKHWASPNSLADNSTGFTAFPCSYRIETGYYSNMLGFYGYWWSSTQSSSSNASYRSMRYDGSNFDHANRSKKAGLSIRCLQDY